VEFVSLHHVALNVTDLEKSRQFYRDVLGLQEIARPPFNFPGAWYQVGGPGQHVHLIVHDGATLRGSKGLDTRDIHFALRVRSFHAALDHLHSLGYREEAPAGDPLHLVVRPNATAGFPQIYVLDPDHNVIEINADGLDQP
jgi:glyoxylase I family protein